MVRMRVPDWLAFFVGGVAGTAARAGLDEVAKASPVRGLFLSWSTLTVNVVGAFLLGALAAWVAGRLARGVGNPASLNGVVEAVSQSLGLLALGAASAWAGVRVGEWLCGLSEASTVSAASVNDEEGRA